MEIETGYFISGLEMNLSTSVRQIKVGLVGPKWYMVPCIILYFEVSTQKIKEGDSQPLAKQFHPLSSIFIARCAPIPAICSDIATRTKRKNAKMLRWRPRVPVLVFAIAAKATMNGTPCCMHTVVSQC